MALTGQNFNTGGNGGCPSASGIMDIVVGNNTIQHDLGLRGHIDPQAILWRLCDVKTGVSYEEIFLSKIVSETINELVFNSDVAIPNVKWVIQSTGCADIDTNPIVYVPSTLVESPTGTFTFDNGLDPATVIVLPSASTPPIATSTTAGVVKPSDGLNIAVDGTLTLKGEQYDEFIATAGQTSFTLSAAPLQNKIRMYIDGVRIPIASHSASGTTATYVPASNDNHTLTGGERIQIDYLLK
jgi:hypothetical protein